MTNTEERHERHDPPEPAPEPDEEPTHEGPAEPEPDEAPLVDVLRAALNVRRSSLPSRGAVPHLPDGVTVNA